VPPARTRDPRVAQKVMDAFEYVLRTPGATLQSAAAHVGMVPRMLRFKMQRPEALRWMLLRKQQELELLSAGNIPALMAVRDHGDNSMARVHSARTLETMLTNVSERTGVGRQAQQPRAPGLQIVVLPALGTSGEPRIVAGPPQTRPLIEGTATPAVPLPCTVPADDDDNDP
jgi:hypothetical protein